MPEIEILFGYLIYITSYDSDEPFHIHIVKMNSKGIGDSYNSEKLWLSSDGKAHIPKNGLKGRIDRKTIKRIMKAISSSPDLFEKIKKCWCQLYNINNEQIPYYDKPSIISKIKKYKKQNLKSTKKVL